MKTLVVIITCLWYSSHMECVIYILIKPCRNGYLASLAAGTFLMWLQVQNNFLYSETNLMWFSLFLCLANSFSRHFLLLLLKYNPIGKQGGCLKEYISKKGFLSFHYFFSNKLLQQLFFYFLFLAVLGLCFCARAFSSCGKRGPLFIMVHGPLTIAASLVEEHRLQMRRRSSCGSRAQLLCGMWDLPRPGLKPVSPALAGRFSPLRHQGSPCSSCFIKLPETLNQGTLSHCSWGK